MSGLNTLAVSWKHYYSWCSLGISLHIVLWENLGIWWLAYWRYKIYQDIKYYQDETGKSIFHCKIVYVEVQYQDRESNSPEIWHLTTRIFVSDILAQGKKMWFHNRDILLFITLVNAVVDFTASRGQGNC